MKNILCVLTLMASLNIRAQVGEASQKKSECGPGQNPIELCEIENAHPTQDCVITKDKNKIYCKVKQNTYHIYVHTGDTSITPIPPKKSDDSKPAPKPNPTPTPKKKKTIHIYNYDDRSIGQ